MPFSRHIFTPLIFIVCICFSISSTAQNYSNPIIHADYSDPDAIRVGNDYYMIASSFNHVPGIPILHSKDLVHWQIIAYALQKLEPEEHYSKVQHGGGVWAPSIRYHNNEFYIYYPDPDFGIYLIKAKNIKGPWSKPIMVEAGKGLIDPCPLWDDDGKVYLVHAYAGSRAGIKSIIVIKELDATGEKIISPATMVYDGHAIDPTVEGPKLYKRNGYYYIFAPAGGVGTGWQIVLRSKHIYGPYERRVVMQQGNSNVNGPHQGAWVNTASGEDWFLHFQDKGAYGRIVHLQPIKWKNDWAIIGKGQDDIGEPVAVYKNPATTVQDASIHLQCSDEFNNHELGLQWQWRANPQQYWAFPTSEGYLRMFSVQQKDSIFNLYHTPNVLTQKFPAETFTVTTKFTFHPKKELDNETFGLSVTGLAYGYIAVTKRNGKNSISYHQNLKAEKSNTESEQQIAETTSNNLYFKLKVSSGVVCSFSYSEDGTTFKDAPTLFNAQVGKWIGAEFGLFCTRPFTTNDAGFVDVDWVRVAQ